MPCFRDHTWRSSPSHQGLQEDDLSLFLMAWDEVRHCCMVQRLHFLSAGQSHEAALGLNTAHPHSNTEILSCSCGFGGSPTDLGGQVSLHPHGHRQNYQMAGGHPSQGNFSNLLHRGISLHLGGPVWRATDAYFRQGNLILFSCLGGFLQQAGHTAQNDYGLPSSSHRPRGKGAQTAEGRTQGSRGHDRLARASALSSPGPSCSS
jgi:hypothetical protein